MVLSPTSFRFAAPLDPHVAGGTTRRSGRPDWVLLHQSARISGHRNATTAECHTMEGQPIQVSFWLVDPPGVSYFSVHCPGLDPNDFALEPRVLCADAAFLLFSVEFVPVPGRTFRDPEIRRCTQRFLYRAGPGKPPSLHLVPDPDIVRPNGVYAILPCADSDEHYAVVFLHRRSLPRDMARYYDLHVFSSVTQAWSSKGTLPGLSEDDQKLLAEAMHATYKVIKVGESSLGFVDLSWGILLVRDVFSDRPVIKYISLPASRVCNLDEDGEPYVSPDYCCDVSSCDSLIKFVEVEFDDRDRRSLGNQDWKATIWNRDLSSLDDDWRVRSSVNAANISVHPSYSHLLPQLWNDKTKELELKKLVFCKPTLSNDDDDFLYVMSKLNRQDDKAWVISVDMKHASVEAIAPYSIKGCSLDASHCPCAFPNYLDLTTPGDDVTMHFQRISVADCVLHVLLAQDWFMKLDKRLEFERPTYDECKSLLNGCPVPSLLSDIEEVVKYEFAFYTGHCEAASKAVDSWSRALEDFVQSLSTEAMRSNLDVVLQGFNSLLLLVPPAVRVLADACHQQRVKVKTELCEKPGHTKESKLEGFPDDSNLPHCKKPIVWVFAQRKTIFKLEKTGQRKVNPLQGHLYANFPHCKKSTAWVLRRKGTFELEKTVQTEEKPRVYKIKKRGWCRKAKWDGRAVVPDRGAEWWRRLLYQPSRACLLSAFCILAVACIWIPIS